MNPTDGRGRDAAHELNNLLTKIIGYTEMAFDLLEDGHPAAAELALVRDAGKRAAELVQELFGDS